MYCYICLKILFLVQTIGKIIKSFKNNLSEIYPEGEIRAITEMFFEHFFNYSKIDLVLKSTEPIEEQFVGQLDELTKRLKNHEPIQYIIGQSAFYNCILNVNRNVLIPRQETEELVDWIVSENKNIRGLEILDIGTGSGCIAISLAKNIKDSIVSAFDISEAALETASKNASKNDVLVDFSKQNILNVGLHAKRGLFDIIVSNPPYVLDKEKEMMQPNVLEYEPGLALFVDDDAPLLFYKAIVAYSLNCLKTNGRLYLEINEAFGKQVAELLIENGFLEVSVKKDINGKNRMVRGKNR
jgi:release factor glutamine methyltransferase